MLVKSTFKPGPHGQTLRRVSKKSGCAHGSPAPAAHQHRWLVKPDSSLATALPSGVSNPLPETMKQRLGPVETLLDQVLLMISSFCQSLKVLHSAAGQCLLEVQKYLELDTLAPCGSPLFVLPMNLIMNAACTYYASFYYSSLSRAVQSDVWRLVTY